MKKAIMTFLVFVIGAFIFVGCGGSTPNTSPVRMTTDPTVPPTTTAKPTTATPTTKAPTTVAPTTEAPKPTDLRISEQQIIFGVGDSFSLNGAVIEKLVSSNWTTAEDSEYTIDSSNYNGEIEGAYSITVSLKNTTVTETYHVLVLENDTFNATYGNTLANVTLPSKLAWKTSTTSVGNAGTNAFDAVFTVDEHTKYDIKVDVVVAKANYTCTAPTGLTGSYGAALSTVSLANVAASCSSVAGTWTWKNGTSIIDATGEHAFTAVFTPTNTNYLTKEIQITLTIAKGTLQVNVNNDVIEYDGNDHGANVTCEGATITYGLTEGTYDLTTSPVYKEMGKYTVYYKAVKANYNDATGVAYIEIKKMPKAKITAFVLQEKYPVYMELTAIEIIHLFDVPGNISWVKSNATIEEGKKTYEYTYVPNNITDYGTYKGSIEIIGTFNEKECVYLDTSIDDNVFVVGEQITDKHISFYMHSNAGGDEIDVDFDDVIITGFDNSAATDEKVKGYAKYGKYMCTFEYTIYSPVFTSLKVQVGVNEYTTTGTGRILTLSETVHSKVTGISMVGYTGEEYSVRLDTSNTYYLNGKCYINVILEKNHMPFDIIYIEATYDGTVDSVSLTYEDEPITYSNGTYDFGTTTNEYLSKHYMKYEGRNVEKLVYTIPSNYNYSNINLEYGINEFYIIILKDDMMCAYKAKVNFDLPIKKVVCDEIDYDARKNVEIVLNNRNDEKVISYTIDTDKYSVMLDDEVITGNFTLSLKEYKSESTFDLYIFDKNNPSSPIQSIDFILKDKNYLTGIYFGDGTTERKYDLSNSVCLGYVSTFRVETIAGYTTLVQINGINLVANEKPNFTWGKNEIAIKILDGNNKIVKYEYYSFRISEPSIKIYDVLYNEKEVVNNSYFISSNTIAYVNFNSYWIDEYKITSIGLYDTNDLNTKLADVENICTLNLTKGQTKGYVVIFHTANNFDYKVYFKVYCIANNEIVGDGEAEAFRDYVVKYNSDSNSENSFKLIEYGSFYDKANLTSADVKVYNGDDLAQYYNVTVFDKFVQIKIKANESDTAWYVFRYYYEKNSVNNGIYYDDNLANGIYLDDELITFVNNEASVKAIVAETTLDFILQNTDASVTINSNNVVKNNGYRFAKVGTYDVTITIKSTDGKETISYVLHCNVVDTKVIQITNGNGDTMSEYYSMTFAGIDFYGDFEEVLDYGKLLLTLTGVDEISNYTITNNKVNVKISSEFEQKTGGVNYFSDDKHTNALTNVGNGVNLDVKTDTFGNKYYEFFVQINIYSLACAVKVYLVGPTDDYEEINISITVPGGGIEKAKIIILNKEVIGGFLGQMQSPNYYEGKFNTTNYHIVEIKNINDTYTYYVCDLEGNTIGTATKDGNTFKYAADDASLKTASGIAAGTIFTNQVAVTGAIVYGIGLTNSDVMTYGMQQLEGSKPIQATIAVSSTASGTITIKNAVENSVSKYITTTSTTGAVTFTTKGEMNAYCIIEITIGTRRFALRITPVIMSE